MEKNVKNIAGVSLVEVMIAMFLVALLLIAIVAVFPRMSGHGKQISDADRAKLIAMEVIEEIQDFTRWGGAWPGVGPYQSCLVDKDRFSGHFSGSDTVGAVIYDIIVAEPDCNGDIYTIGVTVRWKPPNSSRQSSITVTGAIK